MWGLGLDPIPTMDRGRQKYRPFREARQGDYDGPVVLGGSLPLISSDCPVSLKMACSSGFLADR